MYDATEFRMLWMKMAENLNKQKMKEVF